MRVRMILMRTKTGKATKVTQIMIPFKAAIGEMILDAVVVVVVKVTEVARSHGMEILILMTGVATRSWGLEMFMTMTEGAMRKRTTGINIWLMMRMTKTRTVMNL